MLRATRALGGEGALLGFAAGRGGRLIAELAGDEGLELDAVAVNGEARVSTVVLGDDGSVTRLYEFGPEIAAGDEKALLRLVGGQAAGARRVGGDHRGGATGRLTGLLRRPGPRRPIRGLSASSSTRPARSWQERSRERPDLVKVNLAEACSAVGEPDAHCADEKEAAPEALEAEGLELCRRLVAAGAADAVLTLGAAGAVAVIDGARWRVTTRGIRAVNPVGSGDCFAAGLALALQRGESAAAALRLAAAAGAANATSPYNGDVDRALTEELAGGAFAGPPSHG